MSHYLPANNNAHEQGDENEDPGAAEVRCNCGRCLTHLYQHCFDPGFHFFGYLLSLIAIGVALFVYYDGNDPKARVNDLEKKSIYQQNELELNRIEIERLKMDIGSMIKILENFKRTYDSRTECRTPPRSRRTPPRSRRTAPQMDIEEFRQRGREMVDYIANFLESGQRQVRPNFLSFSHLRDFILSTVFLGSEDQSHGMEEAHSSTSTDMSPPIIVKCEANDITPLEGIIEYGNPSVVNIKQEKDNAAPEINTPIPAVTEHKAEQLKISKELKDLTNTVLEKREKDCIATSEINGHASTRPENQEDDEIKILRVNKHW